MRKAVPQLKLDNVEVEGADARALAYPDESFDLITSISVFEHIAPEPGGEVAAAMEVGRVLAPGGTAIITVPFSQSYFAEYREGDVYERRADDEGRTFFQRFYDSEVLQQNVIGASGLRVERLEFIEERHFYASPHRRVAHHVNSTGRQKLLFGIFYYPLSRFFLSPPQALRKCRKPYIACLVLRKDM